MKKIAILALAAITTITGCDIDRLPNDRYSADKIMADKAAALDILLNGCYAKMKNAADVFHRTGEYPGDNICKDKPTTNPFGTYITYQHTVNNGQLSSTWNNAYTIISQASDLMKLASEGESAAVDQKLGEAYYMRGQMYFYLARVFARPYYQDPDKNLGLPIVNGMPEDIVNLKLPDRSTIRETYDQAISDLKKAESLMTKFTSAAYVSKYAAQAMLAKVYTYMSGTFENPDQKYAESAAAYANEVIEKGPFKLLNRDVFMKYNEYAPDNAVQTETIFAVKFVASEITNYSAQIGSMYATIGEVGWGEIYASAKYLDLLYETGKGKDAREAFIRPDYKLTDGAKIRAFRFIYNVKNSSNALTGYSYKQGVATVGGDGLLTSVNMGTEASPKMYALKLVDKDKKKYSIEYNGETYIGDDDYYMNDSQGHPKFFIYKCSLQDGVSHLYSPTITRLAEMYLIRAEANAKMGKYTDALKDLNIVRERSLPGEGYKSLDVTNAHRLIMKERQLEFAFEADRGFDVYRVGETMTRHYPGYHNGLEEFQATSPLAIQYIPQSEINAYPGTLTQNP
ncbi:MAG: RagB/SusD family nutrient uptake outer membrane protein [Tannerellaceae bacterium]